VIDVVCVGRARGPLAEASAEYERRLARLCRFALREVREEPLQRGTVDEVLQRERARVEPLPPRAWLVALDRGGEQLDSEQLARFVELREREPPQHTVFLIGGAAGLAPELLRAARTRLSLGAGTLPHQLARVVLLEQLYRSFTIARGDPYHR
jgi:23S rRNA (pseudouridine1915-N3)-methyltransferase